MKLRNVLAVLSVLVLAATLATLTSRPLGAQSGNSNPTGAVQGSAPVSIVSPLPVPVSGSTTVSGSVAATQSGTWNVGINGTPTVTVTTNQPVETGKGFSLGQFTGQPVVLYVVPTGKRLVVEYFSSEVGVASGTTVDRYALSVANDPNNPGAEAFTHFIPPAFSSPCGACVPGTTLVVASQPIRLYVEAGQGLVAGASFSGAIGSNAFGFYSFSGYLVDVP